jgi:hypothetical protein
MRVVLRGAIVALLVSAGLLSTGTPAEAATNLVPGQSIQAAINAAAPGTVINVAAGTYRETLLIRKDGIKLRGAGAGESGTILVPPAHANSFCGDGPDSFPGICVLAKKLDANFNIVTPVSGVEVSGFLVRQFPGDGIVSFGADHTEFLHDTSAGNQGYGITSFVSTGNVFDGLLSRNNGAPGFYIGDSPNADFVLKNSVSVGNQLGILVREANHGELFNNVFRGNCVGIFMLNHGNDPAADVRVQKWNVHDNRVENNNKICEGDNPDGFGGIGVALLGTKYVLLENNNITGNQYLKGAPPGAGVFVSSTTESDGGNNPMGNIVRNNTVLNNKPFDIVYDGTGTRNWFPTNNCETSNPGYICA